MGCLLCSRNARPQKDERGAARCPSCSQNAHDETVLAWDKSESWLAQGWAGRTMRAVKGSLGRSSRGMKWRVRPEKLKRDGEGLQLHRLM